MPRKPLERRYHTHLEAFDLSLAGRTLKAMREAVGLSMTGVEREGPISRAGLYHWEDGEPGINAFRYGVALARTGPEARAVLLRATDAPAHELEAPDPELEVIMGTIRELWSEERNRNALRPIFRGLADLVS